MGSKALLLFSIVSNFNCFVRIHTEPSGEPDDITGVFAAS